MRVCEGVKVCVCVCVCVCANNVTNWQKDFKQSSLHFRMLELSTS